MQTFLFADLSGFTALTEAHGDEQAADLVGGFCVAVRRLLTAHQAQEVKTIGDALMLPSGERRQSGSVCASCTTSAPGTASPGCGWACTPARPWSAGVTGLEQRSTWRLASRPLHPGGDALPAATTRTAAGDVQGVELRERGRWTFRNVTEPVQVYAASARGAEFGWAAS